MLMVSPLSSAFRCTSASRGPCRVLSRRRRAGQGPVFRELRRREVDVMLGRGWEMLIILLLRPRFFSSWRPIPRVSRNRLESFGQIESAGRAGVVHSVLGVL